MARSINIKKTIPQHSIHKLCILKLSEVLISQAQLNVSGLNSYQKGLNEHVKTIQYSKLINLIGYSYFLLYLICCY